MTEVPELPPMTEKLQKALDRARNHKMTPEEIFEQRVSFVYGQQDHDNPNPRSKEEIRQMLIESQGRPACEKCAKAADTIESLSTLLREAEEALGRLIAAGEEATTCRSADANSDPFCPMCRALNSAAKTVATLAKIQQR